jgi:putative transposase
MSGTASSYRCARTKTHRRPCSQHLTLPSDSGPAGVRVTIARLGRGGDSHEEQEACARSRSSGKLREADRLLAEGSDVDAVCRQLEISIQAYQRWRSQFKAMRPEDVVRLKALEKENARLKRLLAEKELDNDMLREVARGNW